MGHQPRDYPVFFEDVESVSDNLLDRTGKIYKNREKVERTSCEKCGLSKGCKTPCIGMFAYREARILFVGEAPGALEDEKGKPFIGESGKLLRRALSEAGLISQCAFTNVVRCRPVANATPGTDIIRLCGDQFLWKDIETLKPQLVVLLGGTAIHYFLGPQTVDNARCEIYNIKGYSFMATVHPAYVLRNPAAKHIYAADFRKIHEFLNREETKFEHLIVKTPEDSRQQLLQYAKAEEVAFDIETKGLSPYSTTGGIVCMGFYDGKNLPTYIPYSLIDFEGMNLFAQSKAKKIMHNGKYDILHTYVRMGIRWKCFNFDTQVGRYLQDELQGFSSLEELAWEYIPQCFGWKSKVVSYIEDMSQCPEDILSVYQCRDVVHTFMVKKQMEESIREIGMEKLMQFICSVLTTFAYIEARGVQIDRDVLDKSLLATNTEIQRLKDLFLKFTESKGFKEFNINSPIQLKKLVFEVLQAPVLKRTSPSSTHPDGQPALDKEVLPLYAKKFPELQSLSLYRKCEKVRSTYLDGLRRHINEVGIAHTSFHMTRTRTGRSSSSDPMNFQNIPRLREDNEGIFNPYPLVKRCFVSRWRQEGYILEADYSQLELRVIAALSQDKNMTQIFKEGGDIHGEVAKQLAGNDHPTDEDRVNAKGINFGIAYGAGPKTISEGLGCSEQEAITFIEKWFRKFPDVKRWLDDTRKFVRKNGYVTSPLGRRRRLPDIYSKEDYKKWEAEREAINSPIQGTAADILEYSLIRIEQRFTKMHFKSTPIVPIHDSILSDVFMEEGEQVEQYIKDIMENVPWGFLHGVPLTIKMKKGCNWAEVD